MCTISHILKPNESEIKTAKVEWSRILNMRLKKEFRDILIFIWQVYSDFQK